MSYPLVTHVVYNVYDHCWHVHISPCEYTFFGLSRVMHITNGSNVSDKYYLSYV